MSIDPNLDLPVPRQPSLDLRKVDAAFSLAQMHSIEHLIDSSGRQYIAYERGIPYPDAEAGHALASILLDRIASPVPAPEIPADNRRWLILPDNYVTMSQALNDSIGNQSTDASQALAHDLFAELGAELAQVAQTDGLVPQHLSHRQVIFLRDSAGVKLTPPIKMIGFESADEARERGLQQLWYSCIRTAVTQVQMDELTAAFKGFEELFTWS